MLTSLAIVAVGVPLVLFLNIILKDTEPRIVEKNKIRVSSFSLPSDNPLYIEIVDTVNTATSVMKFSRDGTAFADSIVYTPSLNSFSVLYYSSSDTLYFLSSSNLALKSYGGSRLHIEVAAENVCEDDFSIDNADLWNVRDSLWCDSFTPRLSPVRPTKKLYVRPIRFGRERVVFYQTICLAMDSNFNLSTYP